MKAVTNKKVTLEGSNGLPVLPCHGVLIESHHHGPGFSTGLHAHPYLSLIYVVSGRGRCLVEKQEHELLPNVAIMLRKNQSHQLIDKPGKAMVVFVLYFLENLANVNGKVIKPLLESNEPLQVPIYHSKQMRKTLRKMLYEQNNRPPHYDIAIQQCLGAILLQLHRIAFELDGSTIPFEKENSSARVKAVLDYTNLNYYEHHSLADAAKMAQLSQRQFTSLCRKQTGKSFVQFVNSIRIEKAKELLQKTTMSVSAVAFEIGYEELSTFYRAFKRYCGLSPLAFRK